MRRELVIFALMLSSAAARASFRQQRPEGNPCVALLVRSATADSASNVSASVTELSRALHERGFCFARSARDADAVVEVLSRRYVRRQLTTGSAPILVDLIRVQITMGEETAEVRGYRGLAHQLFSSAAADAAGGIQRWLEGPHGPTVRKPGNGPDVSSPAVALDTVLARAAAYVAAYETQFATVIGEELYRQQFTQERVIDANASARPLKTSRSLRSELSLAWFPDMPGWFGFRDVVDVDGKPVKDRDRRLATLFFEKPTGKLLKRALQESARYNLGTIRRNFNVPMVALQFLEADVSSRFHFQETEPELVGDVPARVVRYQETTHPTIILINGEADASVHGRFWIEAQTGRVLETELVIGNADSDIRIRTWYRPDARLGIWVPSRMMESYDYTQRLYDVIECEATYANFRRFETAARLVTPK